jgi:hypothetical protein
MQFPVDSTLPRDLMTLNPHFSGDNPDALLGVLQANLNAWSGTAGKPFTLKAYDAAALPPTYPLATREQTGTVPNSPHPREVACCLSYYTGFNRPRFRGRLYLPALWLTSNLVLRPTQAIRDLVLTFATGVLAKSLPTGHVWGVWSKTERKFQGRTDNIWCDDEWDTVRSRGLRSTTRSKATI